MLSPPYLTSVASMVTLNSLLFRTTCGGCQKEQEKRSSRSPHELLYSSLITISLPTPSLVPELPPSLPNQKMEELPTPSSPKLEAYVHQKAHKTLIGFNLRLLLVIGRVLSIASTLLLVSHQQTALEPIRLVSHTPPNIVSTQLALFHKIPTDMIIQGSSLNYFH